MGPIKNKYAILVENKGREHLGNRDVEWWIILKWIFDKYCVRNLSGFNSGCYPVVFSYQNGTELLLT
jgi:hypothetical protein